MDRWVSLGCTERPRASVESLQGTRKSLSQKVVPVPMLSFLFLVNASPICCVELGYNVHVQRIH